MAQLLYLGAEKTMIAERSWRDNGKDPEWAFVGGQKVKISEGSRPRPEIFQRGTDFFYKDGTPVTKVEDVDYLPEPYKTMAQEFVNGRADKVKANVVPVEKAREELAAPAKRGRGRPPKTEPKLPARIEIKDEASLIEAGGIVV